MILQGSYGSVFAIAGSVAVVIAAIVLLRLNRRKHPDATGHKEEYFKLMAESIPQIVWTAIPGGGVDYCNQRLCDLSGLTKEEICGWGWQNLLHPDDRPLAEHNWLESRRTGKSYDVEYRLRTAAGGYRWHLVRATPMRDSAGTIVKWYGSCADIDDQMRHQQVLEDQVKQHTEALMDANTRLRSEMRERAMAQEELNLQSERMVRELTIRSHRSTALVKMAERLQSSTDVKDACAAAASLGPKIFPELRGGILLFNASDETLELAAGWADGDLPSPVFSAQDCRAMRTGQMHVVRRGDQSAACRHAASTPYSYACLPLQARGEAIGLLHLQWIEPVEHELSLVIAKMFGEQLGLSVANIRLREALRSQAIRDPLTGLYNRRYLEEMMERETRRAVRAEHGLGVLMLDLDHFKKFNDTFGHEAGDTVLRETAAFLLKSVRAEDIVCRFGGEEFVVILPVADLKTTQARAERIRSRLRELSVVHQGKTIGPITVSIGVAELPQHGTTYKELLEAADAALYRAKAHGRDRIIVADAPVPEGVQVS